MSLNSSANFTENLNDHVHSLSRWEWWSTAMSNLIDLNRKHGNKALDRANSFSGEYFGRRGSMVVDVIASRQRKYESRVRSMVAMYESNEGSPTLLSMATRGPERVLGLRVGEASTMQTVAAGLLRFARERDLDEDFGVAQWASSAAAFVHAPKVEPYVGATSGVGPALFAYLRMRCGADAIKPDTRVHTRLVHLGFNIPLEEHSIVVIAQAAASELGVSLLTLDQLLWWTENPGNENSDAE